MFWSIISRSTRLGLKAGAAAGALYFPASLFVIFVCGTLWNLTHPSLQNNTTFTNIDINEIAHGGPPVGFILIVLLMALPGGFFGTILGFLNGVLIAVTTKKFRTPPTQMFKRIVVAVCVLLSLAGSACLLHLLFATDLFTNFSDPGTPSKPSGPTRMIGILKAPEMIALVIAGPSLVAAAIAYWASNQVLSWYAASVLTPLESNETLKEPASLDHLWPL